MTDIPNTEYITINKDGVFVGTKPTTTYHGQLIRLFGHIEREFVGIQSKIPEIKELHVGAFATRGESAKPGNPSADFGPNAWCRVKLFDGRLGPWVFVHTFSSAFDCAAYCALYCGIYVRCNSYMCSALLNFATTDKANTKNLVLEAELKQALQKIDLSKYVEKKIELNGYVITVQKQK